MKSIVLRNLKIFFRDKAAVFFSLLGVFIVIGLYILFLGDVNKESLSDFKNASQIMDSWIFAGLLSITSVTSVMGAFGAMVQDREKKVFKDFYCAPISRSALTLGYIVSSAIVGLIMTGIVLVIAIVYLTYCEAIVLSAMLIIKLLLLSALTSLSNTALVLFIVSFLTTEKAYSAVTGVLSALIGFITGIYLPVGSLPEGVQYVVKCFPPSHSAVLFRQVLCENSLKDCADKFPKEAQADALAELKETLGIVFNFGDNECASWVSLAIIAGALVGFSILAVVNLNRKKNV